MQIVQLFYISFQYIQVRSRYNLNHMSYQKKSLILQQLEQAIRKKAQQKSRNKDQVNRAIQGSIQKKKNVLKTTTNMNKEARIASIHKNSQTASKQNLAQKPVSIFNNEHLTAFDTNEFKAKKYNNRRLDKLVSLIQYVLSSSEKALRYISSNNFQAEFALKLFKSDRQNLVNQLKNLNFDDIIDSHRHYEKNDNPKQDHNFNILLQQNNKLKKQILILQKQAQSYHNKIKDGEWFEIRHLQKENLKLKETLRKLIPFEGFKQIMELLQKQNKFEIMLTKSQQNSKKTTEIQIVIASIQNERTFIVESLSKMKDGKSERTYKLSQIQGQKEQLQKELAHMKVKLSQIIDSGKSISQLQLIKKNSQLVAQKLASILKDLNPNALIKKSSQQLLDSIKQSCASLKNKNSQLAQALSNISEENEDLKQQISQLKQQKEQLQNELKAQDQQIRMHNMLSQIQKLRDIVDQLSQNQQSSNDKIQQLCQQLNLKDQRIKNIIFQLQREKQNSMKMNSIVDEVNQQMQLATHKFQEKEHYYKEKAVKAEQLNRKLQAKYQQIQQQNEELKNSLDEALRRNESRQDSKLLFTEKIKIDYQNQYQLLERQQDNLQKQLLSKQEQINHLQYQLAEIKQNNKQILQQSTDKQSKVKQLQAKVAKANQNQDIQKKEIANLQKSQSQLKAKNNELYKSMQNIKTQNQQLVKKIKLAQNNLIISTHSKEQNHFNQAEKQNLLKKIELSANKITYLQQQIKQSQEQYQQKQARIEQLQTKLSKQVAQNKKMEIKHLQSTKQLNNVKQQLQYVTREKQSAQKLIQQQRQKHINQIQNINSQLQQIQLINIQLSKEKIQAKQQLQVERENIESLNQKIDMMHNQIRQLEDQIKSLTLLSNQALSQRQHSREIINHIEEERSSLKNQLNSAKQKIQDHSQINRFKNKQYVNLLRQILKGLYIDPLDYADKTTFQELLEFGSEKVVQLRKRQREQESNKRKNDKKEYDVAVNEFDQPNLEECKAQLFNNNENEQSNQALFSKQINYYQQVHQNNKTKSITEQNEQKLDINDFGQLKEQENNSVVSQQENIAKAAELEQFNDLQSQKMNESMISNNDLNLQEYQKKMKPQIYYEKDDENENNIQNFKNMQESKFSQNQSQNESVKSQGQSQGKSIQMDEQNISNNKSQQNSSINNQMQNNSMLFQINPIGKRQNNLSVPSRQYSKYTIRSIAVRNQKVDLDEFQEVKSVQDNHSVVSNNDFGQNLGEVKQDQDIMDQSDVKLYPLRLQEDKEKQVNLQQFKELDNEALSQSMLSEKQENINIDQFGDLAQSGLGQSMISNQFQQRLSINSSHGKQKHEEELNIDQFGQVQMQMNNSMVSNKNSQHGLSQFGELAEEKLNDSVLSKQEKQHGMSQFGQIQENQMNDSILSNNLNSLIKQSGLGEGEGQNFDEFDEYKSQKMSQSMVSQGISPREPKE